MLPETTFAARLDLALKALSIGRARLAQELGVDKSLISRWLGGTTRPAGHNLERLTLLIATRSPGFTLLDWDRGIDELARRFGVAASPPASSPPAPPDAAAPRRIEAAEPMQAMHRLPFGLVEAAEKETARRARSYCARWRLTRLSASGKLIHVVEHALIRPQGGGLWFEHFAGGHRLCGWMLVLGNRLYAMVADEADDSFGFYLLNGVVGPRAERLDGILTSVGSDRNADPFALVVVLDRVGELSGDAADDAWGAEALDTGAIDPAHLDPAVRSAIERDFGPATLAGGGDAILRIPHHRSLARGALKAAAAA